MIFSCLLNRKRSVIINRHRLINWSKADFSSFCLRKLCREINIHGCISTSEESGVVCIIFIKSDRDYLICCINFISIGKTKFTIFIFY